MDARVKEIIERNDHRYQDFRAEMASGPHTAVSIYHSLEDFFGFSVSEIPADALSYYTDVIDEEGEGENKRNVYYFEYDKDGEVIGIPGIQRVFEIAHALGDSDQKFQVRYMVIPFSNKKGISLPTRVSVFKMEDFLTEDAQNRHVAKMEKIADTRPTKILLFRLIKLRS